MLSGTSMRTPTNSIAMSTPLMVIVSQHARVLVRGNLVNLVKTVICREDRGAGPVSGAVEMVAQERIDERATELAAQLGEFGEGTECIVT